MNVRSGTPRSGQDLHETFWCVDREHAAAGSFLGQLEQGFVFCHQVGCITLQGQLKEFLVILVSANRESECVDRGNLNALQVLVEQGHRMFLFTRIEWEVRVVEDAEPLVTAVCTGDRIDGARFEGGTQGVPAWVLENKQVKADIRIKDNAQGRGGIHGLVGMAPS